MVCLPTILRANSFLNPDSESALAVIAGINALTAPGSDPRAEYPHLGSTPLCCKISIKNILQDGRKCATVILSRENSGQSQVLRPAEDDYWWAAERFCLAALFFFLPALV